MSVGTGSIKRAAAKAGSRQADHGKVCRVEEQYGDEGCRGGKERSRKKHNSKKNSHEDHGSEGRRNKKHSYGCESDRFHDSGGFPGGG